MALLQSATLAQIEKKNTNKWKKNINVIPLGFFFCQEFYLLNINKKKIPNEYTATRGILNFSDIIAGIQNYLGHLLNYFYTCENVGE